MSRERVVAVVYGMGCHLAFLIAIVLMGYEVYFGFTRGIMPIGSEHGRLFNLLLIAQFPVVHSFLLTTRGRWLLWRLVPLGLGERLATTTFALIASLQLLLVFLLWTPTTVIWYSPTGGANLALSTLFAVAWCLLVKAIADASVALHTGFLGWSAVFRGEKPRFPSPAERGAYRYVRQPIYLAFALILLCGPVWSPDHLAFTVVWGAYCIFGPRLKERRFSVWYGTEFQNYQRRVPYMIPRFRGRREGGTSLGEGGERGRQHLD